MKPQPMSDAERNGRVSDLYDELAKAGEIGHHETLWRIVRLEVERAIAARDAQWAAMIGEPVTGRCRWESDGVWMDCSVEHVRMVQREPHEWPGYEALPLYAIKEPK